MNAVDGGHKSARNLIFACRRDKRDDIEGRRGAMSRSNHNETQHSRAG
eukprot:CAMPEP_0117596292 /NCGR_PEP_ID=MMETSP0784-20121206/74224_1 /TAXON_ID=39447 /ORGANISM="" /LENGTH=47 /DNA_ID= /DNA_START= /DNA_END= /DNA_ORIENTATION=